jgi:hypothetical protein
LAGPAYRVDLGTEWRARRWRRLLNFIDGLPRNSAFVEAMSNDVELAEAMAVFDPPTSAVRLVSEWSPTVETLTTILDRLGELIQTVAVVGRAKPGRVPSAPRPVTAMDRVRKRRREMKHKSLVSRLLPDNR